MEQGASNINGPHQGAWVHTNAGQDWFIHFQDKGAYGRITNLQPMTWKNDWPIIGIDKDGDGIGTPVSEYVLPKTAMKHTAFKTDSSLHFQWNATPSSTWRMEFENGFRHYAFLKNDSFPNLWNFPAMYLAKLPAAHFIITKLLKFNSLQVGERAGFILFGKSYASLELENTNHGLQLNYVECEKANIGSKEKSITLLENAPSLLFVRMQVREGAIANFSYSIDGKTFIQVPNNFKAVEGVWVGAKYGFYCASNHPTNDAGFLETN